MIQLVDPARVLINIQRHDIELVLRPGTRGGYCEATDAREKLKATNHTCVQQPSSNDLVSHIWLCFDLASVDYRQQTSTARR